MHTTLATLTDQQLVAATFLLCASKQTGFDLRTVQPVVSRYNDWATRPTI
jgi:hypothetical protein